MFVYFATSHAKKYITLLKEEKVKNILFSFAFFKTRQQVAGLFEEWQPENVIIDSGAFSVWSRGDEVDIDQYANFCLSMKEQFPKSNLYFVNLDVLPGKFGKRPNDQEREQSAIDGWKNMEYLESKGLKVIPVFHQHEDFKWLDKLKAHTDYIGISPANDVSMDEKMNWLNKVFAHIRDTVKTHGFAVTSYKQLFNYPFYSVDSSSWTSPSRFGTIPIFTDDMQMKVIKYKDKKHVVKMFDSLSGMGIDKISSDDWSHRIRLSIRSYLELEKQANKLWKGRGINYE